MDLYDYFIISSLMAQNVNHTHKNMKRDVGYTPTHRKKAHILYAHLYEQNFYLAAVQVNDSTVKFGV